eukprot:6378056-Prymnesium_polylepis.1
MLKSLHDAAAWPDRLRPAFVWAVQSFNLYNLRNSGISPDGYITQLRNASARAPAATHAAAAALLGSHAAGE